MESVVAFTSSTKDGYPYVSILIDEVEGKKAIISIIQNSLVSDTIDLNHIKEFLAEIAPETASGLSDENLRSLVILKSTDKKLAEI